jgi:hypothetical protein
MLLNGQHRIFRAGGIIPAGRRIQGRDKDLPASQKLYHKPPQGASLFLPFCLLLFIIFLPLFVAIRARKPLLRFLLRFESLVMFLCVAILYLQK